MRLAADFDAADEAAGAGAWTAGAREMEGASVAVGRRCAAAAACVARCAAVVIRWEIRSPEVGEAIGAEAAMLAAEGAAAMVSIAAVDVVLNNLWRVEPTQYPQRTCVSLANLRVSEEPARFTSNLREYRNV